MTKAETTDEWQPTPEQLQRFQQHMAERTPHAQALGLALHNVKRGEAWLDLPYQPTFIGDAATGVMHGGVITTLLDHACGAAVQLKQKMQFAIATLDLRIDYMKPARSGATVRAHAHCYQMTKNIAFVRATAYQDGEDDLIANAVATFMLAANRSNMRGEPSPIAKMAEAAAVQTPAPRESASGVIDRIPYARFLGVETMQDEQGLVAVMRFSPHLIGNPVLPALHGGSIGAFLETTAMLQVAAETGGNRSPKPIGITINYLRSGKPVDTYARAKITKEGRRVVNIAVEAWQEDPAKPIASAYGHFLLKPEADEG